jgi:hypothetical protein
VEKAFLSCDDLNGNFETKLLKKSKFYFEGAEFPFKI